MGNFAKLDRHQGSRAGSLRDARGGGSAAKSAVKRVDQSTALAKGLRRVQMRLPAAIAVAVLGLAVSVSAIAAAANASGPVGSPAKCPWLNRHLPIARRVALLMHKMTVAEEVNIVGGHGEQWYVGNIQENRALCMPALGLEDGPNGVGDGLKGVTNLPSGASLAATFSRRLAYEYGRVIGAEQAAKGTGVDLGPTVNIDRDPRWGREFESLSEDPALAADLAVAEIRGIQRERIIAQVKHFDAYNQEANRNTPNDGVIVSRRALHEIYMPAFRAAVRRAAVGSIMCAYSTVNGHYSCQSHYLLTRVLRDEWDFGGFVTSDWGAVHNISAARAGDNMEEPHSRFFGARLQHAVETGAISRAMLNTLVEPILDQMFRFEFFNHPRPDSIGAWVTAPAHRAISTKIAEAGTVLLKNDDHLLPLARSASIAVIGPAASTQVTYGGGGSAYVIPSSTITPLAGIEAMAGRSDVIYAQGLPTDMQLTPIPAADRSRHESDTKPPGSYSESVVPPQTGTYIIGFTNGCGCYGVASLAINGRTLLSDPGTPPVATYLAAVHLKKGETYVLTVSGSVANSKIAWATPSTVHADIRGAARAARSAQVAVVVVADDTESEGADRPDLRLPSAQSALVSAVARANPHTVVVVQAGAPVAMPWLDQVPAILDTWYPGQTNGAALANVLFGRVDPSGHLPVTFPARLANVPAASPERFPGVEGRVHYSEGLLVGYRWYEARHIKPMFPFGFGLSYTRFRYSDLHLSGNQVNGVTPIQVSARVTNVGRTTGTDVAQLYLAMPASTGEPPRKLVGFERVTLAPGQTKAVHFTITPREEWWWNHDGWTETAGTYEVYVGDSSAIADLPLTARYAMEASIGERRVTVSAPKSFTPGVSALVRVSLSAGGSETLHDVRLTLQEPGGWRVVPLDNATRSAVAPDAVVTRKFSVTPPSWAVPQYVTLYATADLGHRTCFAVAHERRQELRSRRRLHSDAVSIDLRSEARKDAARCSWARRHGGVTVAVRP